MYSCFCSCCWGDLLQKKPQVSVVSKPKAWTFQEWIRVDLRSRIADMTSYFQYGGHDVITRREGKDASCVEPGDRALGDAYSALAGGFHCSVASQPRVTSLTRCMRYSTWSTVAYIRTCLYKILGYVTITSSNKRSIILDIFSLQKKYWFKLKLTKLDSNQEAKNVYLCKTEDVVRHCFFLFFFHIPHWDNFWQVSVVFSSYLSFVIRN